MNNTIYWFLLRQALICKKKNWYYMVIPDLQSWPYLPGSHISQAVPWNPSLQRHSPLPYRPSLHWPLLEHQFPTVPGHLKQSCPKYPGQQEWSYKDVVIRWVDEYGLFVVVMEHVQMKNLDTFVGFKQFIWQPCTYFLFFPTRVRYLQFDFMFWGNFGCTLRSKKQFDLNGHMRR